MRPVLRALAVLAAALALPGPLAAEAVALRHSPWLALRFEQGGAEVPLANTDLLRSEVTLARAPFTIVLPVRGADDTYMIAGWTDEGIFTAAKASARAGPEPLTELPPYFREGTGMADTAAGSGVLMLNAEGHNHLYGLRLGPDYYRHAVSFSAIGSHDANGDWRETPISAAKGPVYLVAWFDEDADGIMRHGEFEFLVLNFR
ncbi:hypothetical protein [Erythrobacter sp. BLCC-B19]|uniref:hypothetical protein n=1 Tax=Erythrobacter sp. BLCC-B19 TaxID=3025315 RepID=UPI00235E56D8|nr:hypothetical protein [Erythrobacter sp. BLCC-B19]WDA42399.1 hypothetical protein PS060_06205 [Erythrobacter sp. BLCC-B19]